MAEDSDVSDVQTSQKPVGRRGGRGASQRGRGAGRRGRASSSAGGTSLLARGSRGGGTTGTRRSGRAKVHENADVRNGGVEGEPAPLHAEGERVVSGGVDVGDGGGRGGGGEVRGFNDDVDQVRVPVKIGCIRL